MLLQRYFVRELLKMLWDQNNFDTLKHIMFPWIMYCSGRYQNLRSVVGIAKYEEVS